MTENTKAIEAAAREIVGVASLAKRAGFPAHAGVTSDHIDALERGLAALTEAQDTHRDGVIEECAGVAEAVSLSKAKAGDAAKHEMVRSDLYQMSRGADAAAKAIRALSGEGEG